MKKPLITLILIIIAFFGKAQTWDTISSGSNSIIYTVAPFDSVLYAGGYFTKMGGKQSKSIAQWNGITWSPVGIGTGLNSVISNLSVYNGELYAGGGFDSIGNTHIISIARWDGKTWDSLGSGLTGKISVLFASAVYNGELYVAGGFSTAGGIKCNNIAKWNGVAWDSVGSGIKGGGVHSLFVFNGILYVGGLFDTAGNKPANKIAQWNGSNWSPLGSGVSGGHLGINGKIGVWSLSSYNNQLIAGGYFDTAGGKPTNNIAEWNGTLWLPLGKGITTTYLGAEGVVSSLTPYNGNLYAGGYFDSAGLIIANGIAQWDGSNWYSLGSGIINNPVFALCQFGNSLIVAGAFDTVGTIPANNIAEWTQPLGIDEISTTSTITLFPNPSNGIFTISIHTTSVNFKVEVYNMLGEKILEQLTMDNGQLTINLGERPSGIYLYRLVSDKGELIASGKLLLQK